MPVPSSVCSFATVGFGVVLQQMPFAVTEALPSDVTLPPLVAEFVVMSVTSFVVTVGSPSLDKVVNSFCSPYAVPFSLVAYALT